MTIEILTPSQSDGNIRIKRMCIDINGKKTEYPQKLAQISQNNTAEYDMARNNLELNVPSEYCLEISSTTISKIVSDGHEHQKMKDQIQKTIKQTQKATNSIYIRFKDEKDGSGQPLSFPSPNENVLSKLFDLVDVEGVDLITLPIRSDSAINWMNKALDVFQKRKPDFLGEYKLVGYIPGIVTDDTAKKMVKKYIDSGIDCLTFDFAGRSVPTSTVRDIIDNVVGKKRWGEMYIHGVNVPHYDFSRWNKNVNGEYDLLMGIYGFDSFSNMRYAFGGKTADEKLPSKIKNQRYSMIKGYGMYRMEGLEALDDAEHIDCSCPICRKTKPLDLYNNALECSNQNFSLDKLRQSMRIHRQYNAHQELSKLHGIIEKEEYGDYILEKKQAENEINSMMHD